MAEKRAAEKNKKGKKEFLFVCGEIEQIAICLPGGHLD